MSLELSIVVGIGLISALFGYYAFNLKDNPEPMIQKLAVLFFFMSLIFVNMTMYVLLLMTQNNATVSYLADPIMGVGLSILTYLTVSLAILFLIALLIAIVRYGVDYVVESWYGRRKSR